VIVGVLREVQPGETPVTSTPDTVARLLKRGYKVVMAPGACERSGFADAAYVEAGAPLGDIVLGVNAPSREQLSWLKPGVQALAILAPPAGPGAGR